MSFESRMNTILGAMTWTNHGSTPPIHLGNIRNQKVSTVTGNILARGNDVDTPLTGSGTIAYERFRGEIIGWGKSSTIRNNLLADCKAEFPNAGVYVQNYEETYYQNYYSFIMEVEIIA